MAIPLVGVAAVAGGVRAALWIVQRSRTKTIVLVGPPAGGKTTLARFLTEENERSLPYGPTVLAGSYTARIPGSKRRVRAFDMPGADGLAAWKESINKTAPDLVCLVLDFDRLITDDDYLEVADLSARHVREMVRRRRRIALILTHTDRQAATAVLPDKALDDPRVQLVTERLGTDTRTAGSLVDHRRALKLRDSIWQWLA